MKERIAIRSMVVLLMMGTMWSMVGCRHTTVQKSSKWIAGKTGDSPNNDIWIEVEGDEFSAIRIYRDLDNDGIIDDILVIQGNPVLTIMKSRNKEGRMDYSKDIRSPFGEAVEIKPEWPEAGPFTRQQLDEFSRLTAPK
jgi:hypothetical protein